GAQRGGMDDEGLQLVRGEPAVRSELPGIGDGLAAGGGGADEDRIARAAQGEQIAAIRGCQRVTDDPRYLGRVVRARQLEPPLSPQGGVSVLAAHEDVPRDRALRAPLEEAGVASAKLPLGAGLRRRRRVEM